MNLDKLTVNVRPLAGFQALDLGMMMARQWFLPLWGLWWRRMLPIMVVLAVVYTAKNILSWQISWVWFLVVLWWFKPFAEMPLVLFLSQKLFDNEFKSEQAWQLVNQLPKKDSVQLLTRNRLGFYRQILLPILLLERQVNQRRQRLRLLSDVQSNALVWQILGFLAIEVLSCFAIVSFATELIPQNILDTLPLDDWYEQLPTWLEVAFFIIYSVVISVVSVFFVASGFSAYICKRSVLEGWDIELKFRKLAYRQQAMSQKNLTPLSKQTGQ